MQAEDLDQEFESHRARLGRIAYAILGSHTEAEDVVQDTWLRLERSDQAGIDDLEAWLSTVAARLALDRRKSARARRETYVGHWLPEPEVEVGSFGDPADRVTLDESVTMALLVMLETLSPAERTSFVLHDVFGMPFDQVAGVVGRTPEAVRRLASRARRHVDAGKARYPATAAEHERTVVAFVEAVGGGEVGPLLELLDDNVVFRADGGGKVKAALAPLHGADRVARAVLALDRARQKAGRELRGAPAVINGLPGVVIDDEESISVMSFVIDAGQITAIDVIRNPEKLSGIEVP